MLSKTRIMLMAMIALAFMLSIGCTQHIIGSDDVSSSTEASSEETVVSIVSEEESNGGAYSDPDNYVYPFNTMSADWGAEVYSEGFKYFVIPDEYVLAGGCFPEVVQVYLWCLCKERDIDYYMVVALIEYESGYRWDCTGDSGNSKGYMQIYEKWHLEEMEAEGVTDLYNPYGNIRVGLNYLQSLQERYLESSGVNCVLMAYNMGESRAKKYWAEGTYSTGYSRTILSRAEEIREVLKQE